MTSPAAKCWTKCWTVGPVQTAFTLADIPSPKSRYITPGQSVMASATLTPKVTPMLDRSKIVQHFGGGRAMSPDHLYGPIPARADAPVGPCSGDHGDITYNEKEHSVTNRLEALNETLTDDYAMLLGRLNLCIATMTKAINTGEQISPALHIEAGYLMDKHAICANAIYPEDDKRDAALDQAYEGACTMLVGVVVESLKRLER